MQAMLTAQHGAEQTLLVCREQIEGPAPPTLGRYGCTDPVDVLGGGAAQFDSDQCVQVTLVRGPSDGVILVKVGHTLVHRTPDHVARAAAQAQAADLEVPSL